jgi:hypothetical protein
MATHYSDRDTGNEPANNEHGDVSGTGLDSTSSSIS